MPKQYLVPRLAGLQTLGEYICCSGFLGEEVPDEMQNWRPVWKDTQLLWDTCILE